MEHSQTKEQIEATNQIILKELKKKLGEAKALWDKEIPNILQYYHCISWMSIRETLFRLTYDTNVMIPIELGEVWKDKHEGKLAPDEEGS